MSELIVEWLQEAGNKADKICRSGYDEQMTIRLTGDGVVISASKIDGDVEHEVRRASRRVDYVDLELSRFNILAYQIDSIIADLMLGDILSVRVQP
jgi:hypothetical protein